MLPRIVEHRSFNYSRRPSILTKPRLTPRTILYIGSELLMVDLRISTNFA